MLPSPVSPGIAERADELAATFGASTPVRHVAIDGFLDEDYAQQLFEDLPQPDAMPKSRDYMFSDKRELSGCGRSSKSCCA